MLAASRLWLLLFLVYVGTSRPASFKDCLYGLFCKLPRVDYELLGFMPADTINKGLSRRIQRTAEKLEKPFGDGIYLIDQRSIALNFASEHFGNGGSNKVAICSVCAPTQKYLNSWSKTYVPQYLWEKKSSLYSQFALSPQDGMRYLQALKEATGVQSGEVSIAAWGYRQTNGVEFGYLMKISKSLFKDLYFDCAEPPMDLSHGEGKTWLNTDLRWKYNLQNGIWKYSNFKPKMDMLEVDKESGEWRILGSSDLPSLNQQRFNLNTSEEPKKIDIEHDSRG
ncbi:hypothetical protein BKA69DRAFT_170426 [Paraphysoderma sedebokerense]|nr:hypothetical protein BKA69DRAFT_170426 [Paraphysoderma sedebokerense]